MIRKLMLGTALLCLSQQALAKEYIIKFTGDNETQAAFIENVDATPLLDNMYLIDVPETEAASMQLYALANSPEVAYVESNKTLSLYPMNIDAANAAAAQLLSDKPDFFAPADNPAIPNSPKNPGSGNDPLLQHQWGMIDNQVQKAWQVGGTMGDPNVVVAVIDTGVDYTHEDLIYNMWRNPNEIPNNNIDDDGNGFVDDIVGWDFVSNDNLPYDLSMDPLQLIFQGGNPGHGTHCAGNVAARGNNGKGITGVAPNVKIMAMRFLSEKGQGTTAGAVQSIKYAVDNGAHILSNSWGSEGDDPNDPNTQALKDAIQYAQDNNVLFVAAAGNGHQGVGYDNDTDSKPAYPASYDHEVILSVAALDVEDALGSFSNWGKNTVDIGAPGVKVYSTVPDQKYADTVFDQFGMTVHWDGTSMATPHVAGAAALYLSANPSASWLDIKNALLNSSTPISALNNKSVSGGKLNVLKLMQ
ncbi:MAG: S8 family serine peptidase [Bdellovibrionota bacterium]|nr:S8 family serine peptidase [Bdellovibrionota bacterium]